MGTRKAYFWKLIKISQYIYQHVQVFEYSSKKFNFTDKLAWYSFKLVLSSEVFKWSTFNRQWLLWLLARSSAWNRENGDLGKKMGTFWGPKNWKRSPWGPGSPNGDPRGSSANVSFLNTGDKTTVEYCVVGYFGLALHSTCQVEASLTLRPDRPPIWWSSMTLSHSSS